MPEIIVKTQKELDKIKPDFEGTIYIEGGTYEVPLVFSKKFDTAEVIARGTAYLVLRNDVTVAEMRESSTVAEMREALPLPRCGKALPLPIYMERRWSQPTELKSWYVMGTISFAHLNQTKRTL